MNSDSLPEKKRSLNLLSRISLYLSIAAILASALSSICLYINWDVIPEEATGPHPWIGTLAWVLLNIMLLAGLPVFLLSLVSVVVSFFKKPRLINITFSLIGMLAAYAAMGTASVTLNRARATETRIYAYNLRSFKYILKDYTTEHNGKLPPSLNWSDALIESVPYSSVAMRNVVNSQYKGLSDYAFNSNLSELKLAELPKDMVLLFETPLAKNPAGGPELMSTNNHPAKGCFVLFGDMHIEFVRAEDFNNLRWKP